MKTLFLMSRIPYPLDTGAKIRTFNLIKGLSKNHSITVIAFGDKDGDSAGVNRLERLCHKVITVLPKNTDPLWLAVKNLFSHYPYSVDKYYSCEMENALKDLLSNETFELIHCDSVQVSRNVLKFYDVPKVLTEHNIESQILKRTAQNESSLLKKMYFYLQYFKLKRYEIFACKRFDSVVTVSDEDKKFLTKFIPEKKIYVVPNGVDTEYFRPHDPESQLSIEDAIVFTGSMDWSPNIDAVKYFCRDILPLIWKLKKNMKFYIVGRNAPKDIIKLGKDDGRIVVTGSVRDVRPYIESSQAFVVPLRIGGGTRLKILEAMSMGKAVISTSIGCEGLMVCDGKDIIVADTPDDFAGAVLKLLGDNTARYKLGLCGRQLADKIYSWDTVSPSLDEAWDKTSFKCAVPILLYHDICEDGLSPDKMDSEKMPYILDKSEFEGQMKFLYDNHYKTISLKDLHGRHASEDPDKDIVIAFDDGLMSNYEKALPILKRYAFQAIFFITAGHVGGPGMMRWKEIKELMNSGMEIGSHSLTHAIPTSLSEEGMEYELKESKKVLEAELGTVINFFSSPSGFYNMKLPEIAKKSGYKAALISKSLLNNIDNGFILNKTSVKRNYGFGTFTSIVRRDKYTFNRLLSRQGARDRLKTILGHRIYNIARKAVLERVK